MEIRFCDLCQESIPDADFESGRAVKIDDRTVCVGCALKRSLSLSGPRSWLTLLLALYAAGVTTFLLVRGGKAPAVEAPVRAAIAEMGTSVERQAALREQQVADALRADLGRLRAEQAQALTRLGDDLKALGEASAAGRENLSRRTEQLDGRVRAFSEQVAQLQSWLVELKARAERLAEAVARSGEAAPAAAPAPAPAPTPAPAPGEPAAPAPAPAEPAAPAAPSPALEKALAMLADTDPGVAFSGTIELGRLKDLRAVPPLLRALEKHKDFYVRLGAADALRELKACDAVPALIDALLDKDDLVKSSVNVALQGITEHEEPFAPTLPATEIRRVQSLWRKWWKENEAQVRARLGQTR